MTSSVQCCPEVKSTLNMLIIRDCFFEFPVYGIEVTDQLLRVAYDLNLMPTLRTRLESLTSRTSDVNDLNELQVVKEKLSKNRFLIVLDDVWNENYNHCMTLLCPFEVGSVESKIIVTTSNQRVALMSRVTNDSNSSLW
ncbi:hypothetical protein Goklo_014324 [Gossypium klotzschianum]|uniref:NB-ARC domain-containing protein n=1 Tax=Gossypium klotzschianum TaxID=34286 RepID=A0A7J8U7D3_9ROSI|nr:hypothetical protein [Gossypium klotzschianum]